MKQRLGKSKKIAGLSSQRFKLYTRMLELQISPERHHITTKPEATSIFCYLNQLLPISYLNKISSLAMKVSSAKRFKRVDLRQEAQEARKATRPARLNWISLVPMAASITASTTSVFPATCTLSSAATFVFEAAFPARKSGFSF